MPHAQMLEIAIAAMVAAVLLFRLYTVLGRRTGNEPTGQRATAPLEPSGNMPSALAPSDPVSRGLMEIALADRSFDKTKFLAGARTAYELIQKAFAAGDRAALRPLLSDDVYAAFDGVIAARPAAQDAAENLAGITDARITQAELHGDAAEVTVAFRAQFLKNDVQRDVGDVWTFSRKTRAADPNWILIATSGDPS